MPEIVSLEQAVRDNIKPGMVMGISGFGGVGEPIKLIDTIIEQDIKDLTAVSVVTSNPIREFGVGLLIENHNISKYIAAHVGTSRAMQKRIKEGSVEVDLIPMGTLVEVLHAAGSGLGGVLTPTGVGTVLEEDHEKVTRNGKDYLFYDPLYLDVAIIKCNKIDKYGNLVANGTTRNISKQLAMAAKVVIAEANEIVEVGEIGPDEVYIPGVLVDYIVQGQTPEEHHATYGELWSSGKMLREV